MLRDLTEQDLNAPQVNFYMYIDLTGTEFDNLYPVGYATQAVGAGDDVPPCASSVRRWRMQECEFGVASSISDQSGSDSTQASDSGD